MMSYISAIKNILVRLTKSVNYFAAYQFILGCLFRSCSHLKKMYLNHLDLSSTIWTSLFKYVLPSFCMSRLQKLYKKNFKACNTGLWHRCSKTSIKKPTLDSEYLSKYRLISNLPFLALQSLKKILQSNYVATCKHLTSCVLTTCCMLFLS